MTTPVVLIVAMESERRHMDTLVPGWDEVEAGVWRTVRNRDLVCIVCGIGMVAAAAATEHAIATYSPTVILNYGCAGAHTRDLFPGDVVVGDRLIHQGRLRFAANGSAIPLEIGFTVPGEAEPVAHLITDHTLAELAMDVGAGINLPAWPRQLRLADQPDRPPQVHFGTVSSGDVWMQDPARIDAGHARNGSLCEDMEAVAIAQVCAIHGVPFLTVKDISNSEFHEATVFEGSSSALPADEVGLRAATITAGVIERLRVIGNASKLS